MAYGEELLGHAVVLLGQAEEDPPQVELRRAVSAAYYALFHLLIEETVAYWSLESSRRGLARMFEHRAMARASERVSNKNFPFIGEDPEMVRRLRSVAEAFVQLQELRHTADYDSGHAWTHTEAEEAVKTAFFAFTNWGVIKSERIAQEYLVLLLVKQR